VVALATVDRIGTTADGCTCGAAEIGRKIPNELADAIAAAVPELYNDSGRLVQLNGNGKLVGVSLVALRELIDKHICGVRVVIRDGVGRKEYFSYQFNSRPHPGPPRADRPPPDENRSREPDAQALDEILSA
jgi:hypothetical protein